ncbi:fatty acid desaturase [Sulfitobacter sp. G21635-S1]|uniref:fatty acid desaturase n=1 Tax=Sulfitobacter sp. G21635-S1 TaxID=3014043 RepID=UPI0022B04003|nr:fatty acid desaturase [Sulfitobacter sp. G21635-S1]MCZ4257157.1 fatty acid desaturase [Sulfitobacter sp. G21635-S1]
MHLSEAGQNHATPIPRYLRSALRVMAGWEWPTIGLFLAVVLIWAVAVLLTSGGVSLILLVLALTLHSSLSHEFLHGGPFRSARAGTMLGLIQPGLFVPYLRFKALHLEHHQDSRLTDPYDDPESNYLDPDRWEQLPRWHRRVLMLNNTLAGRMLLGPLVGMGAFLRDDLRLISTGNAKVRRHWLLHLPGVVLTLIVVSWSPLPVWLYLVACYGALSVLKIRTFLEHQAHARASGRTVVVEDRGLLALLFLNNNFHVVHHVHPQLPWYRLPGVYAARRDKFLRRNHGYVYRSYAEVFRRHLFSAKDPVAHPLWRGSQD